MTLGLPSGPIYRPRGAAGEYCPLALNPFLWCPHGCLYCYAPGALHRDPFFYHIPVGRVRDLKGFDIQCAALAGSPEPVFLSFIGDPFPRIPTEAGDHCRTAILDIMGKLHDHDIPIRTCTKNPFPILASLGPVPASMQIDFGVSLVWVAEEKRAHWEPGAGPVGERLAALKMAKDLGLQTWLSVEPVIEPEEALRVIDLARGFVDVFRIGKLNHRKTPIPVDWAKFLLDAEEKCRSFGLEFHIKESLEKYRSPG